MKTITEMSDKELVKELGAIEWSIENSGSNYKDIIWRDQVETEIDKRELQIRRKIELIE